MEEKERTEKLVDQTTIYAHNFLIQHNIITLHTEICDKEGEKLPQVIWLNAVVG